MGCKIKKEKTKTIQIQLNARRFFIPGLRPAEISKIMVKLKNQGVKILKVKVKPSTVDGKKGAGQS